jgi:F-type H+-transporting ATPase subunit b
MRSFFQRLRRATVGAVPTAIGLLMLAPTAAFAQAEATGPVNLLEPKAGLMVWTLVVFIVLMFILSKFAYKPLFAAVEERERALEDAVEGAKRDREAAAGHLREQLANLESARVEAQKIIADSRQTAEKVRTDLLEQTKLQQAEMLDTARRVIESEKVAAIADMRVQAIDLAIAGASRVIDENLDSANNRKIVESFLSSLSTQPAKR